MAKLVFIGAGSIGFTRGLIRDVFTFPGLREDLTIGLVDTNPERLTFAKRSVDKIITQGGYRAKVEASLNRKEVLRGANAVMVTILCGDVDVWQHDILIPKKYGVDINVGDTRGPSGIFRALRTIPEMLAICRDVEKLAPRAILLNYTNPMAMLCNAMQQKSGLPITGLCHSVQGTAHMLANWVGVPEQELDYLCAGINHLAWYLKLEHKGQDLYPRLKKAVATNKKIYQAEQVRNELFLALGSYVTESSGHNSEYNWWFRKTPALIEKYCTNGTNWNPGHHAYILDEYRNREKTWKKDAEAWFAEPQISLARGHEYAAPIINAYLGGELYKFNGNVPNTGLVTNLPAGCCVEVPVLASRRGFEPMHAGALPLPVAAITSLSATVEMMAVEGALTGNAELIYQAIANDPLTAAVLSLAEIRKMVAEMFKKNRKHLPQFKVF
jgi:alpha-galactosidase